MRLLLIVCCSSALAACAAHRAAASASAAREAPERTVQELWVDASAAPDGDGTRQHPLRDLRPVTSEPGPRRIHIATGLYPGPFVVGPEVELEGSGTVVLHGDDPEATVVSLGDRSALDRLTIQGGAVGIRVAGDCHLDHVQLSGQRHTAIQLEAGRVEANALDVVGTVSETIGISARASSTALDLRNSSFRGALRTAISLPNGGTATLSNVRFEDPVTAVSAIGARVIIDRAQIAGGRGPALALTGGTAALRHIAVLGHEYGLLLGPEARAVIDDFTSIRPDRAGLALVHASVAARNVLIVEAGSYGGIQSSASELDLARFLIVGAKEWGVAILEGRAALRDGTIRNVTDPNGALGDGVQVRRAQARAEALSIDRVEGTGVLAAEGAEVELRAVDVTSSTWGSVAANTGARIDVLSLDSLGSRASAVVVPEAATIRVDALVSQGDAQGPIYAECGQGAEVFAGRVKSDSREGLASRCIGILNADRPAQR